MCHIFVSRSLSSDTEKYFTDSSDEKSKLLASPQCEKIIPSH